MRCSDSGGSGVRTGMARIGGGVSLTRRGLLRARTACSAAAAGTPAPGTAGQRGATSASRTSATSVSGSCWPQVSHERQGSGGAARSRRGGARDERSLPAEGQRRQYESAWTERGKKGAAQRSRNFAKTDQPALFSLQQERPGFLVAMRTTRVG